ncbi:MAG: peptide-methionine (S)-S-oxide reductase MsrA [Opitutales bacterium]
MTDSTNTTLETATFGAGCFWCVEAVFERLDGVHSVDVGYMGGHVENPDYHDVSTGETGHAEVIRIRFDPEVISYDTLLDWLWRSHDPTTPDRQGADVGPQYRSVIFYHNEDQRQRAEASKEAAHTHFDAPIVTEIKPAGVYYPAEDYHQKYHRENRDAPYCRMVIDPKLETLGFDLSP